jgi:hypothetical protein
VIPASASWTASSKAARAHPASNLAKRLGPSVSLEVVVDDPG